MNIKPSIKTLDELISELQAIREKLPGDTPITAYDVDDGVDIGPVTVLPMFLDDSGELWVEAEEAKAECPETGLRQFVAIRCYVNDEDYQ